MMTFMLTYDLDLSRPWSLQNSILGHTFLKEHIGLGGLALNLLESYLAGRTQCVSIKGVLSEMRELVYGVLQNSLLGPIEFCIHATSRRHP